MAAEIVPESPSLAAASQQGGDEDLFQFDALSEHPNEKAAASSAVRAPRAESAAEPETGIPTLRALAARTKDALTGESSLASADTQRSRRFSRPLGVHLADRNVWVLGAALLLINVAGLGIVLRSQETVESLAQGVDEKIEKAATKFAAAIPAAQTQAPSKPTPRTPTEGDECLERAARSIERGAFDEARRSLYGLLAVADRLDAATRVDLEARASFLIADSYRVQADALEGASR